MRSSPYRVARGLVWLLLAAIVPSHVANASPRRTLRAVRVASGTIQLDGRADEAAWAAVPVYGDFVQRDPKEGAPPTESTQVAIAYDDDALYVFVRAADSRPERIEGQLARRDEETSSDWIEVWIDPRNDRRTGYRFGVNPLGVQLDGRFSEGGQLQDLAWNAAWAVATSRDAGGWSAELRVPFSELRYERDVPGWGFQVSRRLQRENEESVLEPSPRTALRPLEFLASLENLGELPAPRWLALVPYGVLGYRRDGELREPMLRGGGELTLRLGSASSLHVSVLPDFAQVEADPSVLNLGAYEVFFPERRQFFLDGQEVFQFPLAYKNWDNESLYYSRRIGARPSRDLGLEDEEIVSYPARTTIYGASKWLGRTSSGLNYGLIEAVTGVERATVDVAGVRSRPVVAPPTSYTVARVKQELNGGRGSVGALGTHVARSLEPSLRDDFVERATAVGADFEWRQGTTGLLGQVMGTHLLGSAAAIDSVQRSATHFMQRPDAEHLRYDPNRTSLSGWGAELTGGKLQGLPWRAGWNVRARSPGLDPNELGYLRRADHQHAEAWVERIEAEPTRLYRKFSVDSAIWFDKTFGAEVTGWGASINTSWEFGDNSSAWLGALRRQEALDPSLLRGGAAFLVPGGWDGWWGFYSDPRPRWQVGVEGNWALRDQSSLGRHWTKLYFGLRPTESVQVSFEPTYEQGFDALQFVEDTPSGVVLGDLSRRTATLTLRAGWALAPGFTLDVYAMPFVTAGHYRSFSTVGDPRAEDFHRRLVDTDYSGDDRFVFAQLRSNVVLRYDYVPGASAYLVYTHEQTEDRADRGVLAPGRTLPELLRREPVQAVIFKLEHRFVP